MTLPGALPAGTEARGRGVPKMPGMCGRSGQAPWLEAASGSCAAILACVTRGMAAAAHPDPVPESRALTGLRGVAAVLVVVHHASLHFGNGLPLVGGLLRKGYLGVDLFFVLSGFVMSMVYGAWFAGRDAAASAGEGDAARGEAGRPAWGRVPVFLTRRLARLWPLHALVLAAALAWAAWQGDPLPSWRFVVANLCMIQGWGLSGEVNPPAWSASTELLAYLLFPMLAGPVLRHRWGLALGLAGVTALLGACLLWSPPLGTARRGLLDIHANYSVLPALRCLAGFLLGMMAWRAAGLPAVRRVARRPWAGPGALLAALGLMLAWANDLLVLALWPVVVVGLHHGRGRAWRLLALGPLHLLGTLSYAIYLIHYVPLVELPREPGATLTVLVLYGLSVLGLSVFAYRVVEQPTRRLMRWLGEGVMLPAARPALAWLSRR